jgi:predicted CXXCH cytochrome family protein
MRSGLKIVFTALIVGFILTASNVLCAEKHECSYCHVTSDKTGKMQLRASVPELCIECHPDRSGPKEHKIGIVPPVKVPELPLSKDGKITCITCHDPHGKSGYPKLLRVRPSDLCLKCHFK